MVLLGYHRRMSLLEGMPHTRYHHVFPVICIDHPLDSVNAENCVHVVKVFRTEEAAKAEAERLNTVNSDRSCSYFVDISHYIPL